MNLSLKHELERREREKHTFVMKNIPRLHRLLMEKFPGFTKYFNYMLATDPLHPRRLSLFRKNKLIAKNY
jgi:hypothetical protein